MHTSCDAADFHNDTSTDISNGAREPWVRIDCDTLSGIWSFVYWSTYVLTWYVCLRAFSFPSHAHDSSNELHHWACNISQSYYIQLIPFRTAFPILQSYSYMGEFTPWEKFRSALKENILFYVIVGVVGLVLLILVFSIGFTL